MEPHLFHLDFPCSLVSSVKKGKDTRTTKAHQCSLISAFVYSLKNIKATVTPWFIQASLLTLGKIKDFSRASKRLSYHFQGLQVNYRFTLKN